MSSAKETSSYKVVPFSDEEQDIFRKVSSKKKANVKWCHVGSKGYSLPKYFLTQADEIRNFPLRPDDVFVVGYPRSGTTWTQELIWLITNNLDFEKAKTIHLRERYTVLELFMLFAPESVDNYIGNDLEMKKLFEMKAVPATEILKAKTDRRYIKTHLAMSLLPTNMLETSKVIYVARHMCDVAVSCYNFYNVNKLQDIVCDFKTFYEDYFSKDLSLWSPYFEHIKEGWKLRKHPNMLFLFYEELSKDMKSAAKRVADFFGKKYSDQQLDRLCEHLQFENFQKNKAVEVNDLIQMGLLRKKTDFIRKGKVGGWREHFDEEMTRHAENWINKELQGTGLRYPE